MIAYVIPMSTIPCVYLCTMILSSPGRHVAASQLLAAPEELCVLDKKREQNMYFGSIVAKHLRAHQGQKQGLVLPMHGCGVASISKRMGRVQCQEPELLATSARR